MIEAVSSSASRSAASSEAALARMLTPASSTSYKKYPKSFPRFSGLFSSTVFLDSGETHSDRRPPPIGTDQKRSSMSHLHVRERPSPRVTANELARYIHGSHVTQEAVIRAARFQPTAPSVRYKGAREAIRTYLADPARSARILEHGRARLRAVEADVESTVFQREDARASIAALDDFEGGQNALGLGGTRTEAPPAGIPPLSIEGVQVSVTLDAMVRATHPRRGAVAGGVLLRMSKGQDAETDGAAARRQELGTTAAVLVYIFARERLSLYGQARPDLCVSVDVQRQEAYAAPASFRMRENNIRAACRAIAARWGSIG